MYALAGIYVCKRVPTIVRTGLDLQSYGTTLFFRWYHMIPWYHPFLKKNLEGERSAALHGLLAARLRALHGARARAHPAPRGRALDAAHRGRDGGAVRRGMPCPELPKAVDR